jgi:predicted DNA-binding transcriptional regulator AlpA
MKILSIGEATTALGVSGPTFWRMMKSGDGPPIIQLSARRKGVIESDLLAWARSRQIPAAQIEEKRAA